MTRRRQQLSLIAVAAALTLGWEGAAGATPITLPQCLIQQSTCNNKLAACNADLAQTQGDLATCNTNLTQTQSDLTTCDTHLLQLQTSLSSCSADVDQLQADLATCTNDLTACEALAFPASGQTTAYQANKNDGIAGAVTVPDDGTVQAGADLSYTDNGDGTITDHRTGLMWEKKSADGGLHDRNNSYYWSGNSVQETVWDWLEDVNGEGVTGFAGHHDWRLPNVKELQSIVNYQSFSSAAPAAFNSNCVTGTTVLTGSCTFQSAYWSSSSLAGSTIVGLAWAVNFDLGDVSWYFKSSNFRVRAVRGGSQ